MGKGETERGALQVSTSPFHPSRFKLRCLQDKKVGGSMGGEGSLSVCVHSHSPSSLERGGGGGGGGGKRLEGGEKR